MIGNIKATDSKKVRRLAGGSFIELAEEYKGSGNLNDAICQLFSTVGDGTGSTNFNVNGSSTSVIFKVTAPVGSALIIKGIATYIEDAAIAPNKYGGLTALTNGCILQICDTNGTTVLLNLTPHALKNIADFAIIAKDESVIYDAATIDMFHCNINVDWFYFRLTAGQSIQFLVRDDLTGLDDHYMQLFGYKEAL